MQIKRIKATNYKTYLSLDLDLTVEDEKPIILIGGMNGGGKTTLFEAICGALYGLKIKKKSQFMELLNNGAQGKVEPKIELEITFTGQVLNEVQTYLLRRTYILNPEGKPVESVYLNMNGSVFIYGTATPASQRAKSEQQVKKIIKANLPEELSQYFLFDAMQSSKLLEDGVFAQIIKDNIENVMGFKKYLQLKRAAEKLQQERSKERLNAAQEKDEYDKLCQEKEGLEKSLTENIQQQEFINRYLVEMRETYKKAKEGEEDMASARLKLSQLESQIKATEDGAQAYTNDIKEYIENMEMETFLSKVSEELAPEIDAILRNKDDVRKAIDSAYTIEDIRDIATKVVNYLQDAAMCTSDVEVEVVAQYIMAQQNSTDIGDDFSFLDASEVDALNVLHHNRAANRFLQLCRTRQQLDADISELPNLKIQAESLQKQVSGSAVSIIKEYDEKQATQTKLKMDEGNLKQKISDLEKKIHRYDVQIQQEPDVQYDTLVKLKPFFEELADTLLRNKKQQIEKEMAESLNVLLLSYKGYIDRVELSDSLEDFSIRMYHKKGNEIALSQLNAASKQIFIQVLLKVLRNLGDYNPPVMIDTVMGVLDEESRGALMDMYFPKLADQTILLCTTSEIRPDSDYLALEPFVSKTFTLKRDVENQRTEIVDGYFGVELIENRR